MTPETRAHLESLASSLVQEVATAIGTLANTMPSLVMSRDPVEPAWTVTIRIGPLTGGAITFGMRRDDAVLLTRTIGGGVDPSDAAIADTLQHLAGRAVDAVRLQPVGAGVLFCVESPCAVTAAPAADNQAYTVRVSPDIAPVLGVWTSFDPADALSRAGSSATRPPSSRTDLESALPANLDVILDIDLPLSVRFGQTEMTVEALTRVGPGSVIDLGRSPDEPVDVLVNGRLVARGEVVVVSGSYGVRILEVVSAADRVRSLEKVASDE